MFCPNCSQEQISKEIKFCSRCGFLMSGVAKLIENGGAISEPEQQKSQPDSPRKRGLKKGLFVLLLLLLVVPILSIITVALNAEPYAVVIAAILLGAGGILRMAYALLFESGEPNGSMSAASISGLNADRGIGARSNNALPPSRSIPVEDFIPANRGNWRDTNDLQPASVTEKTTNLLNKEID